MSTERTTRKCECGHDERSHVGGYGPNKGKCLVGWSRVDGCKCKKFRPRSLSPDQTEEGTR